MGLSCNHSYLVSIHVVLVHTFKLDAILIMVSKEVSVYIYIYIYCLFSVLIFHCQLFINKIQDKRCPFTKLFNQTVQLPNEKLWHEDGPPNFMQFWACSIAFPLDSIVS